ncbi:MAG: hypothetical protein J7641_17840 [Cyanobacteria bacterium SID2]|nr:hypothetical protein [Cyanobacteria bacterium SID2]MBP0002584.1 hypothetical protein [Cyanobacteria bacterium SBC]
MDSEIYEQIYKNKPLNEAQKSSNREKSKIRAKVDYVFCAWVMSLGGKLLRSTKKIRAEANIGLKNSAYNIRRYIFWETQKEQQSILVFKHLGNIIFSKYIS